MASDAEEAARMDAEESEEVVVATADDDASASSAGAGEEDDDATEAKESDSGSDTETEGSSLKAHKCASPVKRPSLPKPAGRVPSVKNLKPSSRPRLPLSSPKPSKPREQPKMRIKLSLKLPTKASRNENQTETEDDSGDEVKATVVGSDEEPDHVAVVAETVPAAQVNASNGSKPISVKRRINPSRPIKMPPLHSPGLLMAPPSSTAAGASKSSNGATPGPVSYPLTKQGFTTPTAVFDQAMSSSGYTLERRSNQPHRGSSVQRQVDDMFDSNVHLALRFPPLLPPELSKPAPGDGADQTDFSRKLLKALASRKTNKSEDATDTSQRVSRKRKRPWAFEEMIPVSLSMNYPQSFVDSRKSYIESVSVREEAIVASQEAEELEDEQETPADPVSKPQIPPIPDPPNPPAASESLHPESMKMYDSDNHPIYIPKGRESCLSHLDPKCFHITKGRYFGLYSNFISDPNFVGANAPGIAGVNASGGAGLATSTAGSSGASVTALTLSASQQKSGSASVGLNKDSKKPKKSMSNMAKPQLVKSELDAIAAGEESSSKKPKKKSKLSEVTELRKVMEAGGTLAESTRVAIIKAAVLAAREDRQGGGFVGPNGEKYPDVTKAFSQYAGIKPCQRCKNNKQGSFLCRVKRQHKDPDYEGGKSFTDLQSLFQAPSEVLEIRAAEITR